MPVDHQRTQHLFKKLGQFVAQCATRPHPEAVHDLRTISRRVEALLDALSTEPDRNQRKLVRRLKRLRRRAGRVRDVDVQIAALRTLKIGRDSGRKAQLLRHLNDRRARRERKLQNALDADTIRTVRRRLARCEKELLAPPPATPHRPRAAATPAVTPAPPKPEVQPVSLALRMFATIAKQQGAFTEATLHRFRTRCKRVRYVAEMAGDDPEAKRIVNQIKRMQDAIGDWHDWLTLTQTAQKLFAEPVDSALLAALRNVTRAKFVEATRHASDLKRSLLARAQADAKAAAAKAAVPAKAPVAAKPPALHRVRPRPRPRVRRAPAKPKPALPPAPAPPVPEAAPPVAPQGLQPHNFPIDKTTNQS
ncbi:MAG: CHAD domain-containing protein [Terriglobales bacterium]